VLSLVQISHTDVRDGNAQCLLMLEQRFTWVVIDS